MHKPFIPTGRRPLGRWANRVSHRDYPAGVIEVPQRFLMGPGPANADPRILAAQTLPLLGHL